MMITPNAAETNTQSPLTGNRGVPSAGGLAGFFASLLGSNASPDDITGAIDSNMAPVKGLYGGEDFRLGMGKLMTPEALTYKNILNYVQNNNMESIEGQTALFNRIDNITKQLLGAETAEPAPEHVYFTDKNGKKHEATDITPKANIEALYEELQVEITIVKTKIEASGLTLADISDKGDFAHVLQEIHSIKNADGTETPLLTFREAIKHAERMEEAINTMKRYLEGVKEGEVSGNFGAMIASISTADMAISDKVAAVQTQLTIEQTEVSIRIEHVKASFASSSSLSGTESMSDKIIQGESILSTEKTAETPLKPEQSIEKQAADVANNRASVKEVVHGSNEQRNDAQISANAESVSEIMHEEDVAANNVQAREHNAEKNKPTYTETAQNISKLNGKKMFTARIEGANIQLEYNEANAEYVDSTATEGGEDAVESLYGSKVDNNTSLKQTNTQTTLAHTARAANIAAQTSIHMRSLGSNGGGEMKFKLHPEELGQVEIEMQVENGKVRGSISVENPEVAEHLARDLQKLQQGLEEAGLTFHEEGFTFLLNDEQGGGNQEGQAEHEDAELTDDDQMIAAENSNSSSNWVSPDAIVDVSV